VGGGGGGGVLVSLWPKQSLVCSTVFHGGVLTSFEQVCQEACD